MRGLGENTHQQCEHTVVLRGELVPRGVKVQSREGARVPACSRSRGQDRAWAQDFRLDLPEAQEHRGLC